MTAKRRRPPVAVAVAERLISSNSLRLENAYPATGARPGQCAKALRKDLATAEHAARLIITRRDSGPLTPAAYLQGVLASLEGHPSYLAFSRRAASPDSAEAIVVRRGLLGADQSLAALRLERRKDKCPVSSKTLYGSSGEADADAARLAAQTGSVPNTSYYCSACGWWHRTSQDSALVPSVAREVPGKP